MSNSPSAKIHQGLRKTTGIWLGPEGEATCVLSWCPACKYEIVVEPTHVGVLKREIKIQIEIASSPSSANPLDYKPDPTIRDKETVIEHGGFAICPNPKCKTSLFLIIKGRDPTPWIIGTGHIIPIGNWPEDPNPGVGAYE